MTIDKIRLKKLAEAATQGPWCWDKGEDPRPHTYGIATDADPECMVVNQDFGIEMKEDAYFIAAASPTTVLALLAEIERLDRESQKLSNQLGDCDRERRAFRAERDQLKAENEALRKALGDCADELSAEIICKHGGQKPEDMHPVTRRLYERDMAAVTEARAALAKAVSHD